MRERARSIYRKLGKIEKVFLLLLIVYALFAVATRSAPILLTLALYVTGFAVVVRGFRRLITKIIWRLRNRLIVAYLFIAVFPVLLIMVLVGSSVYFITGQLAVYLVNSELERRTAALNGPARFLLRTSPENRQEVVNRMVPFIRGSFPSLEVVIQDAATYHYPPESTLSSPPLGWKSANGLIVKDGRLYSWAHEAGNGSEATLMAPVTHDFLTDLVPGLGDVYFLDFSEPTLTHSTGKTRIVVGGKGIQLDELKGPRRDRIPPPANRFDFQVTGFSPVPIAFWQAPQRLEQGLYVVHTRVSAVWGIVFGSKLNWTEVVVVIFIVALACFLILELSSVFVGISITRTITGAVHDLYEGTERVKEGDFSHRIPVRGNDQLAELGKSFNTMTENLQRLIVVAKEKERLQSELEIAREVQSQLFPRNLPSLKTLQISGVCNAARMVSGDYYDFLCLQENSLAFAIGDVAGKGISAALLMAAIQSIMRAQLTAGVLVPAGGGNGNGHLSTAHLVSLLNKQLYANTSSEKYATFYFGLYDEVTHILTYTNAGHLPPILVREGNAEMLDVTGTVVGAFPFARYEEQQLRLRSCDILVGYTDGITEPENAYGEMFGEDRLKELLVKHAGCDTDEIIARTMEAVGEWTGAGELQDDMTLLVMRHI